jgi:predicted PilT family ATPase
VFGEGFIEFLFINVKELESGQVDVSSIIIKIVLEDRLRELEKLEEQVLEMEIEIETQEADRLEEEIRSANQDGQMLSLAEDDANSQQAANLLVGEKYLTWPFEGEFWADEINNYRSYLKSQCKEEE